MNHATALVKESKKLKSGTVHYWVLRWRDSNGKHRSRSLGRCDKMTKRAARKQKLLMESGFDSNPGTRNTGRALTLQDYTDMYFEARRHELAAATISAYRDGVRYLLEYYGPQKRIDQISRTDAALFKTALAGGKLKSVMAGNIDIQSTTVNRYMRGIKAVFSKGVKDDLLPFNPFDRTVTDIKKSNDWHYVSPKEVKAITEASAAKFRVAVSLCRLAGLRRMEALQLEWSNIDWDKNRITVVGKNDWQPKSRKARVVPMCQELQAVLLEAYENAPEGQSKVLFDVYDRNLTRDIKAAVARSGVEVYLKPLHTLRKSCITDWAGRYPMHVVQYWAGHASITTTQQFYLKVQDTDFDQAANSSFWDTPKAEKVTL